MAANPDSSYRYFVRVQGCLPDYRVHWFDDLVITWDGQDTLLTGTLPDAPAVYGLLEKLRDLGMVLSSLQRIEE